MLVKILLRQRARKGGRRLGKRRDVEGRERNVAWDRDKGGGGYHTRNETPLGMPAAGNKSDLAVETLQQH